jgi:uncharacterized lipoprotein YajG
VVEFLPSIQEVLGSVLSKIIQNMPNDIFQN